MDWLFNTAAFLPRSQCGPGWTDELMWSYIISNFITGLCYLVISAGFVIMRFTNRDPFLKPWWSVAAALFFFGCGGGHFLENTLVFWYPAYRFYTAWQWFTLASSVPAAIGLPSIIVTLMWRPAVEDVQQFYKLCADLEQQRIRLTGLEGAELVDLSHRFEETSRQCRQLLSR